VWLSLHLTGNGPPRSLSFQWNHFLMFFFLKDLNLFKNFSGFFLRNFALWKKEIGFVFAKENQRV
jgi:hypothetical protein